MAFHWVNLISRSLKAIISSLKTTLQSTKLDALLKRLLDTFMFYMYLLLGVQIIIVCVLIIIVVMVSSSFNIFTNHKRIVYKL